MPRFEPFAGLRYDGSAAQANDLVSPPYDVVSPAERRQLAARSAYNAIHLELPEPDAERGLDRYEHAAALLSAWRATGILVADEQPSLYVYRMTFHDERGAERSTTGVIGALGLDPGHSGQVLPHERTMPKPKGDRLDLLRATCANLSPIWGLSLSPGLAAAASEAAARSGDGSPAMAAVDEEGATHELWPVSDPERIEQVGALVAASPVVVADGHHRYETACFYQSERRAAHGDAAGPYDLVMALVVELSNDELAVGAIHRLIAGLPPEFDLGQALGRFFAVEKVPGGLPALLEAMSAKGGLGLVDRSGHRLLVPLPAVEEAAEADLDSSRLDVALTELPAHELVYQHGAELAAAAVADGQAEAAVLLRPATVAQIADTAHSGHRMPPKTTFFRPKPRTGMVYRLVGN